MDTPTGRRNDIKACPTHHPVSHWRTCQLCARRRQAHIADVAEALLSKYPLIAWVTLEPGEGRSRTIDAIRDAYIRQAGTEAGIWTIEQGAKTGILHANILTHDHRIPKTRNARVHVEPLQGSIRNVAAYISKRSQLPDMGTYNGRLYGRWGSLNSWLAAPDMPPVPRAAYMENHILKDWGPMGKIDPRWLEQQPTAWDMTDPANRSKFAAETARRAFHRARPEQARRGEVTLEEARHIARDKLPKLRALMDEWNRQFDAKYAQNKGTINRSKSD